MKRRLIKSLVLLACMVSALLMFMAAASASGYFTSGAYKLYLDSNNTLMIDEYQGSASVLTIPSSIQGYPVVAIDGFAFDSCSTLTSVTIPSSVKSIGPDAFNKCSSLSKVVLPAGLTTIATQAFSECISLTSINIPSTVVSISSFAFSDCTSLSSIQLPAGLKSIGQYAFYSCSSLSNIIIPNNVTSIGASAFSHCDSLTSIVIPNSVVSIGEYGFYHCDSLNSVKLSDNMTTISNSLFCSDENLGSIAIPGKVKTIASNAFSFIDYLYIGIPQSVTSIAVDAFSYCNHLTIVGFVGSYAQTYANNNYIYFHGLYPLPEVTNVTVDKTLVPVGATVNCSIGATGGKPPLIYGIDVYKGATMIYEGPWEDTNSFSYTFTETGTYKIVGYVADDTDEQDNLTSSNIVVYNPLVVNSVTSDKSSTVTGSAITWTTAATNGSGTKTYLFNVYKGGVLLSSGAYSTASTFKYTPTTAGTYSVLCYVKDSTGTVSKKSADVLVYAPLSITSVKSDKSSAVVGSAITWTTTATGGSGAKTYLFKLYKGTQLLFSGTYGTAATYKYTFTTAGTYSVLCWVKDSTGSVSMKSTDIIIYTPLSITSVTADKAGSVIGSAITWTTKAAGGNGTKSYLFKVYKGSVLLYTGAYSTASTFKYTPTTNGTYSVMGYVKDSTGTVSKASANVTVAPLSITSVNADKTSSVIGSAITWTTTATGGSGAKTYRFELYKGTVLLSGGTYSTASTYKYTPTTNGTYNVIGYVKDSTGTVSKKSASVIVAPLSITSVKADKASAVIGTAITWTATVTGGNGAKTYLFKLYKGTQLLFSGSYGTAATYRYTPTAAGTYSVVGYAKDSSGTVVSVKSADVIIYAPLSITSVNADKASSVIGSAITWTTTAAGGSGAKTYLFKVYKSGVLVYTGTYGTTRTFKYTPATNGTYSVLGYVKDSTGTVSKTSGNIIVAPLSIASVKADKTNAVIGTAITWTTTTIGGNGAKTYLFKLYKGTQLQYSGSYGAAATCRYTPTAAGTYSVTCFVKDSAGTVVSMKSADVIIFAPLSITSVKADKTSTVNGTAITWTTAATGGNGAKSYLFNLYKDTQLLSNGSYGTAATYSYTPTDAGTYSVMGFVKDSTGTVSVKSEDVTVYEPLSITSVTADKASADTGTEITWTTEVTGGDGSKSYLFELYKGDELLDGGIYGAAETFSYTPAEAGTYSVMGFVKDSTGTVSMKSADVIVNALLSITSVTADKTSAAVGTEITWTAAATGGDGTKSYLFELYKGEDLLDGGAYGAVDTFSYTPSETGTYSVMGFVKDNTGTVSVKGDVVTVYETLSITSVTADKASADTGTEITWTTAATGGDGTKSYRFELYKGEDLLDGGSYGAAETFSYTPAEAGTYSVMGFVKDSTGTVSMKSGDVTVNAPLSITSVNANKTSAQAGTEITWTISATGGSGTKSYLFELYKGEILLDGGAYGAADTFNYTPAEAGTYSVKGFVKDSTGTVSMKSGDVTVYEPLSITSVHADKTSSIIGSAITWTTAAAGGSGTKSYLFELYKGEELLDGGSYGAAETFSYTPTEAGTYSVTAFVKDSTGTVSVRGDDVVAYTPLSITSVTADRTSAQVGTAITWTTAVAGGSGTKSYLFELYKGEALLDGGVYGAVETFSYTPAEAGTYSVKGFVKDSLVTVSVKGDDVTVYNPLSIASVTADRTSANTGTEITWTAVATGGSGTKSYLFELYKDNVLLDDALYDGGSYGASDTFRFTPTEAGTYKVSGYVKDSTGTLSLMSGDVTVTVP